MIGVVWADMHVDRPDYRPLSYRTNVYCRLEGRAQQES